MVTSLVPSAMPVIAAHLLWSSGAWAGDPDWRRAWVVLVAPGWRGGAGLVIASVAVGAIIHPMSGPLSRLFEGYWGTGRFARWLAGQAIARQRARRDAVRARLREARETPPGTVGDAFVVKEAGRLDGGFPSRKPDIRATALGNALARHEIEAGAPYRLWLSSLAVVLRLVSNERDAAALDDARLRLDLGIRMVTMTLLTSAISAVWLWRCGLWMLLAVVPYALAVLLYTGCVTLAEQYGAVLSAVLHVNRHELYRRMGLRPVTSTADERDQNARLMLALRADEDMGRRRFVDLRYDVDSSRAPYGAVSGPDAEARP